MFPWGFAEMWGTCTDAFTYVSIHSCPALFCEVLAPVHLAGVSIPLHLFCLCTCASACFELLLVDLCSKQSILLSTCTYISVMGAFFPSGWGLMAWLSGFASHGSSLIQKLAVNSGSSWMFGALNLRLAMILWTCHFSCNYRTVRSSLSKVPLLWIQDVT